jgi:hypothetical protein
MKSGYLNGQISTRIPAPDNTFNYAANMFKSAVHVEIEGR